MKSQLNKQKRAYLKKEKALEKKHYRIIIGFMILDVCYFVFEPFIIGNDIRYWIFIFWIPFIAGKLAIGIYRKQYIINSFGRFEEFKWRFIPLGLYFIVASMIFSYIILGMTVRMGFKTACYLTAKRNPTELIIYDVNGFMIDLPVRSHKYISGKLNDDFEEFPCSYKYLEQYKDANPKDYVIMVTARKGVWNHYYVEDWEVVKK